MCNSSAGATGSDVVSALAHWKSIFGRLPRTFISDGGSEFCNQIKSVNVLSKKLSILGSKLILESLEKLEKKKAKFVYQDDSRATYAKKIEKKESEVNWNISAKNLIAKINGLNPIPGVWFKHLNTRLKIIEAVEVSQSGKIGEVLDNYLTIACKDKAIKILMIQKEGKNALNAKSFLAGYKIKKGEIVN